MSTWSNSLAGIYNDSDYIKTLDVQSRLPYAYHTNLRAGAQCQVDMLPQTAECRGFYVGAKTVAQETNLRSKPTHLGEIAYKHPNTELVNLSSYRAVGEGRFGSDQVDMESSLLQPGSQHSRGRIVTEEDYKRWDYQSCNNAVESYRRGGVDTRLNNMVVLSRK